MRTALDDIFNSNEGNSGMHHDVIQSGGGYEHLIQRFFYEHVQFTPEESIRFEAISAAVFGTKQRRFGSMPSVEVQASVRQIIRDSGDHLIFFLPWGSRKQVNNANLDVMEFMALKQLACLQEDLARYGVTSEFHMRIEDMTDYWLFNDDPASNQQVDLYARTLANLGDVIFKPGTWHPHLETQMVSKESFFHTASIVQEYFDDYLRNGDEGAFMELSNLGWKGRIPPEQRAYYLRSYEQFYAGEDQVGKLAQYFASSLTRVILQATALPQNPKGFIFLTFGHPIPGNPNAPNRLFYRSIPQRFTNNHRSPWLATGYLVVNEDETQSICPKSLGYGESLSDLIPYTVDINGVKVDAPYILA